MLTCLLFMSCGCTVETVNISTFKDWPPFTSIVSAFLTEEKEGQVKIHFCGNQTIPQVLSIELNLY